MSKPDFDFSKYFEVPDEWIESALNIPNAVNTRPKVLPIRRYVAAASIVLVVALGISVFFLFGNKKPIPVKPDNSGIAVQSASESVTASDIGGAESTQPPSDAKIQPATGSRKDRSTIPTHSTQPSQAVVSTLPHTTENSATHPYMSPTTEPPQSDPTDAPQHQPTHKPGTPAPPSPTQPKVAPTSPPATSAPATVFPTEEQKKTGNIRIPSSSIEMTVAADEEIRLYCRVYDSQGRILGDSNLYAPSHLVDISLVPSAEDQYESAEYSYTFEYLPSQVCGTLRYQLYTQGDHVVYTGTVTI